MSEIVTIKTGKAPVEHITAKLSVHEIQHIVATYKKRDGYVPSWIRTLERAANGDTQVLAGKSPLASYVDSLQANTYARMFA